MTSNTNESDRNLLALDSNEPRVIIIFGAPATRSLRSLNKQGLLSNSPIIIGIDIFSEDNPSISSRLFLIDTTKEAINPRTKKSWYALSIKYRNYSFCNNGESICDLLTDTIRFHNNGNLGNLLFYIEESPRMAALIKQLSLSGLMDESHGETHIIIKKRSHFKLNPSAFGSINPRQISTIEPVCVFRLCSEKWITFKIKCARLYKCHQRSKS